MEQRDALRASDRQLSRCQRSIEEAHVLIKIMATSAAPTPAQADQLAEFTKAAFVDAAAFAASFAPPIRVSA